MSWYKWTRSPTPLPPPPQPNTHPPRPPPLPPTTTSASASSSVRHRFPTQPPPAPQPLPDTTTPPRAPPYQFNLFLSGFLARTKQRFHQITAPPSTAPTTAPPVPDLEANAPNPNPNPNPNILDRIRTAIVNAIPQTVWEFYYSLFPRSEEFRTVFAAAFTVFDSHSTRRNDILWKIYKLVFVLGLYGVFSCVLAGVLYSIFGEATTKSSSPQKHIHSFKLNSPAANTISLGLGAGVFSLIYLVCAKNFWADIYFYNIREKYVALVSLDLVVNLRIIKAVLLTIYSLHNLEKKWGDWTIVMFVLLPFFFTMSSISFLKLFEREFLNATGLLRDFAVILVGPCFTYLYQVYQHYHSHHHYSHDYSLFKGLLYLIAILFGYISNQFVGYIYRPHTANMGYAPDHAWNMNYGPINPHVRR